MKTLANTSETKLESTSQKQPSDEAGRLLAAVKSQPREKLAKKVQNAEKLNKSDEDHHNRLERLKDLLTVGNIRRCAYWLMFVVFILFVIHTAILFYGWVHSFAHDAEKLENYIFSIINYVLVIFATLFAEGLVRGKRD
jgi:hypothetical protein